MDVDCLSVVGVDSAVVVLWVQANSAVSDHSLPLGAATERKQQRICKCIFPFLLSVLFVSSRKRNKYLENW